MLTSMAVSQQREGMKERYAFWETQPVAQFTDLDEHMPVSLAVHQACSLLVWWATTPSSSALPLAQHLAQVTIHAKSVLVSHCIQGHSVHSSALPQNSQLSHVAAVAGCGL